MTEKAGKAEAVTEYDSEFESLCQQLDQIKVATEHMLTHVESIVQPNPSTYVIVLADEEAFTMHTFNGLLFNFHTIIMSSTT